MIKHEDIESTMLKTSINFTDLLKLLKFSIEFMPRTSISIGVFVGSRCLNTIKHYVIGPFLELVLNWNHGRQKISWVELVIKC